MPSSGNTHHSARSRRSKARNTEDLRDLRHLVPERSWYDKYVKREVAPGVTDIDVLEHAHANRENVLFLGPTGLGKTSAIMAYAAREELPVAILQCNGALDPAAALGMLQIRDGDTVFVESDAIQVIRQGGVLYFDEINFLRREIASVFYPLLDARRTIVLLEKGGEAIVAADDLLIVASMNPAYAGTWALSPALKNRFTHHVVYDYDAEVERQLVSSSHLLRFAADVRKRGGDFEFSTPLSTNKLIEFERNAKQLSFEYAVRVLLAYFSEEERPALSEIFELYRAEIQNEYLRLDS